MAINLSRRDFTKTGAALAVSAALPVLPASVSARPGLDAYWASMRMIGQGPESEMMRMHRLLTAALTLELNPYRVRVT